MLSLSLCAGGAAGQGIEEIRKCSEIVNVTDRLACYDSFFRDNGSAQENQPKASLPIQHKNWSVSTEVSSLDDSKNVFLISEALETNRGRFGNEVRFRLLVACRENVTSVWIHFGGMFMSDYQHGKVTYRLDKQKAKSKSFRESNNNEALGLWNGGSAIPFIRELFGHERLLIVATPHSESSVEATFDISGIEDVIIPLKEACKW